MAIQARARQFAVLADPPASPADVHRAAGPISVSDPPGRRFDARCPNGAYLRASLTVIAERETGSSATGSQHPIRPLPSGLAGR